MEMKPGYEWDEVKRRSNRTKHGVDFTEMEAFEWDTAIVEPDDYEGEYRWIAQGFIGAVLHLVVYTERGNRTRIISLRKARPKERKNYAENRQ